MRGWTPGSDCPKRQASAGRVANPQNFQKKKNCGILYLVQQIRPSWFLDRGGARAVARGRLYRRTNVGREPIIIKTFKKKTTVFSILPRKFDWLYPSKGKCEGKSQSGTGYDGGVIRQYSQQRYFGLQQMIFLKLSEKTTPFFSRYLSGGCEGRCQGTENKNPANPKKMIPHIW